MRGDAPAKAARYWGLSQQEYYKRADVWPLNKNGELFIATIIESLPGLEHVREIAADPAVAQLFAGYGTLGGVFRGDPAGREAAAAKILAACKEFKKPCGFPVNNPQEMEQRMAEGWTVFIMQRRDEAGMAAVETGRDQRALEIEASTPAELSAQQARLIARMDLVDALEQGRSQRLAGADGLRLKLSAAQRDQLVSDPKGDRLDAVLCLMQAAWAQRQREQGDTHWGLPANLDPVEGWILSA